MNDRKSLRKMTDGERLWLHRRRNGVTQDAAAKRLGLGQKIYASIEMDETPGTFDAQKKLYLMQKITCRMGRPSSWDMLALARRRAKMSLVFAARFMKVSRVTILAMERRGDAKLKAFWEKRGFRF